jgi:cysteine-rich repeat protein
MNRMTSFTLSVLFALTAGSPSNVLAGVLAADPGPVGDEFLAAGRAVPGETFEFRSCFDGHGNSYRLVETTSDPTDPARAVFVERKDQAGNPLDPIPLESEDSPLSIQCSQGGTLLVQVWDPDQVHDYLVFDAGGAELGRFDRDSGFAWFGPVVHDSAGIYEVRFVSEGEEWFLAGRWLDWNGEPRSKDARLGADALHAASVDLATDEAGNVIVTWVHQSDLESYSGRGRVEAQMVDVAGDIRGPAFVVSQGEGVWPWGEPHAIEEETGLFAVFWFDGKQGGLVGRRVSVDPNEITGPVTTTTLPGAQDPLEFGTSRKLGLVTGYPKPDPTDLVSDGLGTWLAGWWQAVWDAEDGDYGYARYVVARSVDNGAHWNLAENLDPSVEGVSLAIDANGTAMLAGDNNRDLYVHISDDSGADWTRTVVLTPPPPADGEDRTYRAEESNTSIATDGDSAWGVAWSVFDHGKTNPAGRSSVYAAFSYDDGHTWPTIHKLAELPSEQNVRLKLAAGAGNNWILAWQPLQEHSIYAVRSADDGASWEEPAELVHVDGVASPWSPWLGADPVWQGSLDLDCVEGSKWLLAFATGAWAPDEYGRDGDIFVLRSADDGATWASPRPVNSFARFDGARDERPSLAVDSSGHAMIAWKSHDALGATIGKDADILRATSADAGETWSRPAPVNAGAESDSSQQGFPKVAAGPNGIWLATWRTCLDSTDDPADPAWHAHQELFVAAAPSDCGDGIVDAAESCDDGNDVPGDGCDPNCTVTSCPNGVVTEGEQCDDGNGLNDDDCVEGCRSATCGDGFLFPFVEACDTAAADFGGACLPTCERATCGDGYVETGQEECDDGNTIESDACRGDCREAVCGDGVVHSGEEECDDGNGSDYDGCVGGCRLAACGDGYFQIGAEQCDPARPIPFRPCQGDCRFVESCTPAARSVVTATGALSVLRFAVGVVNECSVAMCDMNGNGHVSVIDAQIALKMAVGALDALSCAESATFAIVVDDPVAFAALQIEVEFPVELGTFADEDGRADCHNSLPGGFSAANAQGPGVLRVGVISLEATAGPVQLMECTFHLAARLVLRPSDFTATVVDATDGDGNNIVPVPAIRLTTNFATGTPSSPR